MTHPAADHALILVVERDPHVRELERYFLEEAGYGVDLASAPDRDHRRSSCPASTVNDGPGIPPDALATIFNPYDRGGAPDSEAGLGLGLSISREPVRRMGGDIEARWTWTRPRPRADTVTRYPRRSFPCVDPTRTVSQ